MLLLYINLSTHVLQHFQCKCNVSLNKKGIIIKVSTLIELNINQYSFQS